ncbi:MAG: helix-turn-helix domain-containing protein [Caulobacter sp.]|nr:helix-turn-helix domain-containing protein [Caulobacter sp.]
MEKGVPIRSVTRSLSVLRAINRAGSLSMMDIAVQSKVPYPTACRIVQTLLHEGMIEREPARKHYRPTALVQTLASGYQDFSRVTSIARPHIVALTKKHLWPMLIATRVGQSMMVRDSTHALTSLSFNNYHPGDTFPLLECASGRAYMAFATDEERAGILESIDEVGPGIDPHTLSLFQSGILFEEIRDAGYATRARNRFTSTPGKTSSIAAPIFENGLVCGALTLVFFSSAIKMDEAAGRYADDLVAAARAISDELRDVHGRAAA